MSFSPNVWATIASGTHGPSHGRVWGGAATHLMPARSDDWQGDAALADKIKAGIAQAVALEGRKLTPSPLAGPLVQLNNLSDGALQARIDQALDHLSTRGATGPFFVQEFSLGTTSITHRCWRAIPLLVGDRANLRALSAEQLRSLRDVFQRSSDIRLCGADRERHNVELYRRNAAGATVAPPWHQA